MRTVLLVEDDPIVTRLTKALLARGGWTVEHAATGRAAITALAHRRFTLVVLDLGLPEIDGVGVVTWLRAYEAREKLARTPVLVASATCSVGLKPGVIDVDGVLQKPIDTSGLESALGSKEPSDDDRTH